MIQSPQDFQSRLVGREEFQERLVAAQDLRDLVQSTGQRLTINSSGLVALFHSTNAANAELINETGVFQGNTWFSASKTASLVHAKPKHDKAETIQVAVDAREIEFSTGTGEFYAPEGLRRAAGGKWTSKAIKPMSIKVIRVENAHEYIDKKIQENANALKARSPSAP